MKIVIVALIVGGLLVPAYADRGDAPEPGAEQIEDSIDSYSIEGSVERLVVETEDAGVEITTLGSDVLFAYGSSVLDEAAQSAVEELIAELPADASMISVDGHTDSRGGDAVNTPLSRARAQAVADVIASKRPDIALTVTGQGSSRPAAEEYPGGSPDYDAMAKNRRVEISITG